MPLGHLAHSCGFRPKLYPERVAPMTVGVPCQPGQREPFEEAVEYARAHRAETDSDSGTLAYTDSPPEPTTASTG